MAEVQLGRYAGPYERPPFENQFIQSPIGLVPKDKGKKTRLIFNLSYPRGGDSVNAGIPKEACSVKYPSFNEAVLRCIDEGVNCFTGKSNMSAAFCQVSVRPSDYWLLVMKAEDPQTGKTWFFIDKCLPFGSSISCAIFQAISDGISFIVMVRANGKVNINYLDDYLFVTALKKHCGTQLRIFLQTCEELGFPVALEKTAWGERIIVFSGLLLDLQKQIIGIPTDKICKTLDLVEYFWNKVNKNVTVLKFQQLCGSLNFLCRAILPGRAFLRRLYAMTQGCQLKPHHHVHISQENRMDLLIWKKFLTNPVCFARPFVDPLPLKADEIDMYSDSSRNFELGFGAFCRPKWVCAQWDTFCAEVKPSIEYLELFALTVGVLNWIRMF